MLRALVVVGTLLASISSNAADNLPGPPASITDKDRIHFAVNQLVRSQLNSGLFPYDFDFMTGREIDMENIDGMNLVRQTSAAFALGEYLTHFDHDPARKALLGFLENAVSNSLPISKGDIQNSLEWVGFYNRWRLWHSFREPLYKMGLLFTKEGNAKLVSTGGDYERAWTGATGLSMIAAIKYFETTGDPLFNETITHWKNGLLVLKVPRRGFREAPHYLTESPYVNGEAWLALAEFDRVFHGDRVFKNLLRQLDEYLIETYSNGHNRLFYSWGTMAAVVRAGVTDDERFTVFIYGITKAYLDNLESPDLSKSNSCGSLEGLATFVAFMQAKGRANDPLVLRASDYITQAMGMNRKLQIDEHTAEILPNGKRFIDKLERYRGAFLESLKEPLMQVDLTGHCLNAMLRLERVELTR